MGDVRAQEQDSDGARKERGRRVQDDAELHTRLVERHVVERLREAVADRRVQQSANHAARPNALPLRAIGKHPQAADEHLRDAGGQGEEEGRLRGRASVVVKSLVMFSGVAISVLTSTSPFHTALDARGSQLGHRVALGTDGCSAADLRPSLLRMPRARSSTGQPLSADITRLSP